MKMSDEVKTYIEKYSEEIQDIFMKVRELIIKSVPDEIEEKMWAKLPSYYVGEKFVRIIPFKNHINIESSAVMDYAEKLRNYKITPKGMLQIYVNQDIPEDVLESIFRKTLS